MEILSITIPVFIMLAVGYIARRKGLIGNETRNFLSKLIYYFAFPALTFRSIVSFDFASTFRLKLVVHNLTMTFIIFVISFLLAFLIKDRRKRGSFNMGCFRTNQGYMGLPIVKGFYGEEAMSRAAVVSGFDSPLVIIFSVFALEIFKNGRNKNRSNKNESNKNESNKAEADDSCETKSKVKHGFDIAIQKFRGFLTNPFVMSAVLGLVFSYYEIPVLKIAILDELLEVASGMALPLALISIGCSIEVRHLRENLKLVLGVAFIKLLAMPGIAFLLAYFFFGFREVDLGLSVILLSIPTSVSSYVMACEMGADEDVMATIIGFTTFTSVLTVSLVQYLLRI